MIHYARVNSMIVYTEDSNDPMSSGGVSPLQNPLTGMSILTRAMP